MRCRKGTDSFVFLFSFLINWDYFWFIKVIEWSKSQTPTYDEFVQKPTIPTEWLVMWNQEYELSEI